MVGRRALLAAAIALCAALSAAMAPQACAQAYPDKPIKMIVPFLPGGPIDTMARLTATDLGTRLGQQVIVENRPGAGSTIGFKAAATAEPDGYTLLFGSSGSLGVAPALYPSLDVDPLKHFTAVATTSLLPHVMVVGPTVPAKTLAEFIAYSKSNKDGLLLGIPGTGSVSHLYGLALAAKTGAKLTFVPYRGDAPARLDLLAGNIHGVASTPDFGLIAEGKARLIGSTGTKRWPQTPDVPTFAEAGYPDLVGFIVWGFAVPAGTPDDIVRILNEATNRALQSERVKRVMVDNAYFVSGGTPEALGQAFDKQISEFTEIMKAGAIKFE